VGRRRDAALAGLVLAPVGAAAVAVGAPLAPGPVLAGVAATLLTEWLLSRDVDRVRSTWGRAGVQVAAVVAAVSGAALAWRLVGAWVLTAAVAGLVAYLGLLAGVELRSRRRRAP
jgi:hypothetical protein